MSDARSALAEKIVGPPPQRDSLVRFTRVGNGMVGEVPDENLLEAERMNAYGTMHEVPLSEFRRGFEPDEYMTALRMGRANVLGMIGMDHQRPDYKAITDATWPDKSDDTAGSGTVGFFDPRVNRVRVRETARDLGMALGHEMTHAGMKYMYDRDVGVAKDVYKDEFDARYGRHAPYRFSDSVLAHMLGIKRSPDPEYRPPNRVNDHKVMSSIDDITRRQPLQTAALMPPSYRSQFPPDEQSAAKAAEWIRHGQQLIADKRKMGPR